MLCRRCKGRLVPETFGDVSEELARMCAATRCINCGCIDDSVVHANRLRHPMAKPPASRGMVRKGGVAFVTHSKSYSPTHPI